MRFRPCIDIHDGKVKQIVGSTLNDATGKARENFVAGNDAAYYARIYSREELPGGHAIILNKKGTPEYEASKKQLLSALEAYPGGLMAGGGVDDTNAADFIEAGASHVIVTSFVFKDGRIRYEALDRLRDAVGRERICLDLSCRFRDDGYYIVTDRWQKFTDERFDERTLCNLSEYASEYLVHGVDAEGHQSGIEEEVVKILKESPIPATYAGGVSQTDDIRRIRELGEGAVDVTVGSALDLFGGHLTIGEIKECIQ